MLDSYTVIGLIVGCTVGGALFLMIVVVVCLVLREGWHESQRENRMHAYKVDAPPSEPNDVIGVAFNDPSMYAADIPAIMPEPLWRRSIRHFKNALRAPAQPSKHTAHGTKGIDLSPLNSNSSGSSSKQILASSEVRPAVPPHLAIQQQGSVNSRRSDGSGSGSGAAPLRRTSLQPSAYGYSNAAVSFLDHHYSRLQPAGALPDGQPIFFCHTHDYYDLSDCFDIVGKRDGEWLVKPAKGVPHPKLPPRPLQPSRMEASRDRQKQRLQADIDRRRFASAYDLYRPPVLLGSQLVGGIKRAYSHSDDLHEAHRQPQHWGLKVITTPFGPGERMNSQYLSGSSLAATPVASRPSHPPTLSVDQAKVMAGKAVTTVVMEVDAANARDPKEATRTQLKASKKEIGKGIVATPVFVTQTKSDVGRGNEATTSLRTQQPGKVADTDKGVKPAGSHKHQLAAKSSGKRNDPDPPVLRSARSLYESGGAITAVAKEQTISDVAVAAPVHTAVLDSATGGSAARPNPTSKLLAAQSHEEVTYAELLALDDVTQNAPSSSLPLPITLAFPHDLDAVGSKDTISTTKSYSRHIAEEFKFLEKYEGSDSTPIF